MTFRASYSKHQESSVESIQEMDLKSVSKPKSLKIELCGVLHKFWLQDNNFVLESLEGPGYLRISSLVALDSVLNFWPMRVMDKREVIVDLAVADR